MISHSCFLSQNHRHLTLHSLSPSIPSFSPSTLPTITFPTSFTPASLKFSIFLCHTKLPSPMASNSSLSDGQIGAANFELCESDLDGFAEVGNQLADASGEVIRSYFRKSFRIIDKEDMSPVTIADRAAEEAMVKIIKEKFPLHAIYGEENGWQHKEKFADFVWVLDPIDGTKSFITGKPLFGTLIALVYKGKPILGIIDQPILKERWIGLNGRRTTLNGTLVSTRSCSKLSQSYLYTTSPHLFIEGSEVAFARVRDKVKVPLYGCDCYAFALLATGFVDLAIEYNVKPYDFLSLVPVIEGAGGILTDWKGRQLKWDASSEGCGTSFNILASGDKQLHQQVVDILQWQ